MGKTILEQLIFEKESGYSNGLYHETQILLAYNSNKIEGSSLTKEQTQFLYDTKEILPNKGRSSQKMDDFIEMRNHFHLFDYLLDIAQKPLSEEIVKKFHHILLEGTNKASEDWFRVGDYKKYGNVVGNVITADPDEVSEQMENLMIVWSNTTQKTIEAIADFHVRFETIHPFQDGNGRVGRAIVFKECLQNNLIPALITDENRAIYYQGLKEYYRDPAPLVDVFNRAQNDYRKIAMSLAPHVVDTPGSIIYSKDVTKKPYSQETDAEEDDAWDR